MSREKRATWFKVFLHQAPLLEAAPNESVGLALKAAMLYFRDGTLTELDPWANAIFSSLKADIDEALEDYQRSVENGKKGSEIKKTQRKAKPPLTPVREAEAEAEAETEAEKERESSLGQKSPRQRFHPPTAEEIHAYCQQMGYALDPTHFLDYYTANGWKVGKNPMKDWKAAIRNWNRKEKPNGKTEPAHTRTFGIQL